MTDPAAFREGVGRLLAEVQRIKAEGDYAAAQALVRDLRRALRSEAARRGRRARRPAAAAVVHRLRHAEARGGRRTRRARSPTSTISYPLDLTAQMLEYSAATRDLRRDGATLAAELAEIAEMIAASLRRLCARCCRSRARRGRRGAGAAARRGSPFSQAEDRRAPTAARSRDHPSPARAAATRQTVRVAVRALGRLERPIAHPRHRAGAAASAARSARGGRERDRSGGAGLEGRQRRRRPRPRSMPSSPPLVARLKVEEDADVRAAICETIGRLPYGSGGAGRGGGADAASSMASRGESITDRLGVAKGFEALVRLHRNVRPRRPAARRGRALAVSPSRRRRRRARRDRSDAGARVRRLALEALIDADGRRRRRAERARRSDPDAQVRRLAMRAAAPAAGAASARHAGRGGGGVGAPAREIGSPMVRLEALRSRRARGDD